MRLRELLTAFDHQYLIFIKEESSFFLQISQASSFIAFYLYACSLYIMCKAGKMDLKPAIYVN